MLGYRPASFLWVLALGLTSGGRWRCADRWASYKPDDPEVESARAKNGRRHVSGRARKSPGVCQAEGSDGRAIGQSFGSFEFNP